MEVALAHLEKPDRLVSIVLCVCGVRSFKEALHAVSGLPVEYFLHLAQSMQTRLGFIALQPIYEPTVDIAVL